MVLAELPALLVKAWQAPELEAQPDQRPVQFPRLKS
jgi:hypothetical protein